MTSVLLSLLLNSPIQEERRASTTGDIRYHREFESASLGNKRTLTVYLPPRYSAEPKRHYPVLYMHDGQNLFDGLTSFIPNKEWRVDETAEALINAGLIEPIIVVGIDNAGSERANEFLPTRVRTAGGKADLYGKMLADDIMPFIDRTFRTKRGPKYTAVAGSSFGGILSLHLAMTRSDKFSKAAVVSPSVWWDNRVMVKRVNDLKSKPPVKIWLDMGASEGPGALNDARALRDAMVAKGWGKGDFAYIEEANAQHNEDAWARRMGAILLFLFGR